MARRKKKKSGGDDGGGEGWLVTFSDLVTLLLTFFVLLLSMSTLDKKVVTIAFSTFSGKLAFLTSTDAGILSTRLTLIREALKNPWELFEKQKRFKDLLFPDELLPPGLNKSTLEQNLEILKRPEGIALLLSDKILFKPEKANLTSEAQFILKQIQQMLKLVPAPVNIAGYTDSTGNDKYNYQLSGQRALAILKYFLTQDHQLDPGRFSISAYGPQHPRAANDTPASRAKNRRVEILLKTSPYFQTYL